EYLEQHESAAQTDGQPAANRPKSRKAVEAEIEDERNDQQEQEPPRLQRFEPADRVKCLAYYLAERINPQTTETEEKQPADRVAERRVPAPRRHHRQHHAEQDGAGADAEPDG